MRVCVGDFRFSGLVRAAAAIGLLAATLGGGVIPAAASGAHSTIVERSDGHGRRAFAFRHRHGLRARAGSGYAPPFSAIVVDARSGRQLYGADVDALRHPASLTKVMTLYLLFEQLQSGKMTLETAIPISEHAAGQEPSKLGIAAGDSLTAEEAIKAIVTRSANDVAVAIAEKIGGDESTFAQAMTRKAHALGMSRTIYRNASGLPNDEQWTTARDLSLLARATEERFPQYFHYFSTREFDYDGEVIGNHNHLLGHVDGVDGIKTGYTRASGFNLLTSVHRDGRSVVGVVLGGRSGPSRDRIMENLIEQHIAAASDHGRPATLIADNESPVAPPTRGAPASAPPAPARAPHTIMAANDTGEGDDSDADETDNAPPKPVPAPAKPFVAPKAAPVVAVAEPVTRPQPSTLDTPAAHGWVKGPMGVAAKNETAKGETATAKEKSETRVARDEPVAAHSGWFIQIGASDDAGKVGELLQRAKTQGKGALASAKPFTEKVVKDGDTIYRARFALADSDSAETACKALKRGGFPCFTAHVD